MNENKNNDIFIPCAWMKRKMRGMKIWSNFFLFSLIEKWEEWKYYVLKLHPYSYIPKCNLKTQFIFFEKK